MNMVDMSRRSLSYEARLLKYAHRGICHTSYHPFPSKLSIHSHEQLFLLDLIDRIE
jgi:hypothetical protein